MLEGPEPLSIDGAAFGGCLPARRIPLDELADGLMVVWVDRRMWAAVWRQLIARARAGDTSWTLGCVGVALPGLRRRADALARQAAHLDSADLDAELLAGFLTSLKTGDLDLEPQPIVRLLADAYNAGRRYLRRNRAAEVVVENLGEDGIDDSVDVDHSAQRARQSLQAAMSVLNPADAELIRRTRVDGVSMAVCAREAGMKESTMFVRRWRAEVRLRQLLPAPRSGE
ncbi:hypothetical protein GCM10009765_23480 [Fodinicola feengrottensis]|uniref:Sigma-70 family RNA polymerase sigma factor n=3 Tax=Fodinicola feengrottensis TaxID=435914 RepID=A0ABN2GMD0_9ACTN